jgi:hypothetical protein
LHKVFPHGSKEINQYTLFQTHTTVLNSILL